MISILRDVKPNVDEVDKVMWWRNGEDFSVKNSYSRLYDLNSQNLMLIEESLLELIWVWKAFVSSKRQLVWLEAYFE